MESVGRESVPQSAQTGDAERQTGPITHRRSGAWYGINSPSLLLPVRVVFGTASHTLPRMAEGTGSTGSTGLHLVVCLVDEKRGECDLVRLSYEQKTTDSHLEGGLNKCIIYKAECTLKLVPLSNLPA